MRIQGLKTSKRVYFIGIGGISMSALARFVLESGYAVSGSDAVRSEQTQALVDCGINVDIGEQITGGLIAADTVVYTDAVPTTHLQLQYAIKTQKCILSRPDLLRLVANEFKEVIAIAGSHGKTTCTSICAHIFAELGLPFCAHIGGMDADFGNYYQTGREYLITEACEYRRNILKIKPTSAVLLNVDKDHMECYSGEQDLLTCFQSYCLSANTAFVCADDEGCRRLGDFPSFGIVNSLADYRATDLRVMGERYSFTVEEYGKPIVRVKLQAVGRCNVYNALAAFAVTRAYGFDENVIAKGIQTFRAVKRRFEKIGEFNGATCICDYAHHPREITATVATAKAIAKGEVYVVFQPHTYSRTKLLLREFINALGQIKNLVIYKTYAARESYDEEGSGKRLSQEVQNSLYADNVYALKTWLKTTVKEGDVVLFLGAGDIYYAAQYIVKR